MNHKTKSAHNVLLGPWQKWTLYGVTLTLWATGSMWLLASDWQSVAMRIHGAAAMGFLMAYGALLLHHVPLGWKQQRERVTGAILVAVNGILILTGWGLYYFVDRALRDWTGKLHWILGLGLPVLIFIHVLIGRRNKTG